MRFVVLMSLVACLVLVPPPFCVRINKSLSRACLWSELDYRGPVSTRAGARSGSFVYFPVRVVRVDIDSFSDEPEPAPSSWCIFRPVWTRALVCCCALLVALVRRVGAPAPNLCRATVNPATEDGRPPHKPDGSLVGSFATLSEPTQTPAKVEIKAY